MQQAIYFPSIMSEFRYEIPFPAQMDASKDKTTRAEHIYDLQKKKNFFSNSA